MACEEFASHRWILFFDRSEQFGADPFSPLLMPDDQFADE